jgi:hypothetical protein
MTDTKISQELPAGPLNGTELTEVVQGGNNRKTTTQDIANLAVPLGTTGSGGPFVLQDAPTIDSPIITNGITGGTTAGAKLKLTSSTNNGGADAIQFNTANGLPTPTLDLSGVATTHDCWSEFDSHGRFIQIVGTPVPVTFPDSQVFGVNGGAVTPLTVFEQPAGTDTSFNITGFYNGEVTANMMTLTAYATGDQQYPGGGSVTAFLATTNAQDSNSGVQSVTGLANANATGALAAAAVFASSAQAFNTNTYSLFLTCGGDGINATRALMLLESGAAGNSPHNMIEIDASQGINPVQPDGRILYVNGPSGYTGGSALTCYRGIDLSNASFTGTGNAAFASPGFSVDGTGQIRISVGTSGTVGTGEGQFFDSTNPLYLPWQGPGAFPPHPATAGIAVATNYVGGNDQLSAALMGIEYIQGTTGDGGGAGVCSNIVALGSDVTSSWGLNVECTNVNTNSGSAMIGCEININTNGAGTNHDTMILEFAGDGVGQAGSYLIMRDLGLLSGGANTGNEAFFGINFAANTYTPINSAGTMILISGPYLSCTNGIDFRPGHFSGLAIATPNFAVDGAGNAYAPAFNVVSDADLKSDWRNLTDDEVRGRIDNIYVGEHAWVDTPDKPRQISFKAQQGYELHPQAFTPANPDKEIPWQRRVGEFEPLLVRHAQSVNQTLDDLTALIEAQAEKISRLEQQLAARTA